LLSTGRKQSPLRRTTNAVKRKKLIFGGVGGMSGFTKIPNFLSLIYTDSEYQVGKETGPFSDPLYYVIKILGWDKSQDKALREIVSSHESLEEAQVYIANQYSEKH
jgi:hypothetical protein